MDQQDSDDVTAEELQAVANYWYWQGYLAGAATSQAPYLFTYN